MATETQFSPSTTVIATPTSSAAVSSIELSNYGKVFARGDIEGETQHIPDDSDARSGSDVAIAPGDSGPSNEREIGALAPADGGKAAWAFLTASVCVEVLLWGFIFSFGIFQEYYESIAFKGQGSFAPVGTSSSGILYLSPPLVFPALQRWPGIRRWTTFLGLVIMCAGLVGASFATSKTALILTQGIIYSLGGSMVYCPAVLFLDEWFVRRKGMAFGVMFAGTGLGGILLPLILNSALSSFGFRTVLRAYAVAMAVLLGPVLGFIRPRLPPSPIHNLDLNFLLDPTFLLLQAGNVLEALGYFLPSIYLPSIAAALGASQTLSTLTIVLVNGATVVGSIIMGLLVDRLSLTSCVAISTAGTAAGVFLLWGFASSLGPLYAFCAIYGLFAGAYVVCWTGAMRVIPRKVARADPLMVFSFLATGRGVGNIVSGPLSGMLVGSAGGVAAVGAAGAYAGRYMPLICFVGGTSVLGGLSVLGRLRGGLFA